MKYSVLGLVLYKATSAMKSIQTKEEAKVCEAKGQLVK